MLVYVGICAYIYAVRKRHAHNAHIRINGIYQYADYAEKRNRICAYLHETA